MLCRRRTGASIYNWEARWPLLPIESSSVAFFFFLCICLRSRSIQFLCFISFRLYSPIQTPHSARTAFTVMLFERRNATEATATARIVCSWCKRGPRPASLTSTRASPIESHAPSTFHRNRNLAGPFLYHTMFIMFMPWNGLLPAVCLVRITHQTGTCQCTSLPLLCPENSPSRVLRCDRRMRDECTESHALVMEINWLGGKIIVLR
jgi:hypothetical protein